MYYTYVLRSLRDGTFYFGSTQDLVKRLDEHNEGRVRYTKGHCPYELFYTEEFQSRSEALKREKYFKSIAGYRWLREQRIIG